MPDTANVGLLDAGCTVTAHKLLGWATTAHGLLLGVAVTVPVTFAFHADDACVTVNVGFEDAGCTATAHRLLGCTVTVAALASTFHGVLDGCTKNTGPLDAGCTVTACKLLGCDTTAHGLLDGTAVTVPLTVNVGPLVLGATKKVVAAGGATVKVPLPATVNVGPDEAGCTVTAHKLVGCADTVPAIPHGVDEGCTRKIGPLLAGCTVTAARLLGVAVTAHDPP